MVVLNAKEEKKSPRWQHYCNRKAVRFSFPNDRANIGS